MKSELLKEVHAEICKDNNIPIDSLEFTNLLINEIIKLKNEIEKRGCIQNVGDTK